jgi:hypothetical protein
MTDFTDTNTGIVKIGHVDGGLLKHFQGQGCRTGAEVIDSLNHWFDLLWMDLKFTKFME